MWRVISVESAKLRYRPQIKTLQCDIYERFTRCYVRTKMKGCHGFGYIVG